MTHQLFLEREQLIDPECRMFLQVSWPTSFQVFPRIRRQSHRIRSLFTLRPMAASSSDSRISPGRDIPFRILFTVSIPLNLVSCQQGYQPAKIQHDIHRRRPQPPRIELIDTRHLLRHPPLVLGHTPFHILPQMLKHLPPLADTAARGNPPPYLGKTPTDYCRCLRRDLPRLVQSKRVFHKLDRPLAILLRHQRITMKICPVNGIVP